MAEEFKASRTRTGRKKRAGVIDRGQIYNAEALRLRGIGYVKLREARKSGVCPAVIGRVHWYDGGEICNNCAVALAASEATGRDTSVGTHQLWIGDDAYGLPSDVTMFIGNFDAGLDIQPFSFELELGVLDDAD